MMDQQNKINPDLARTRAQATFDCVKLTHFLTGGPEKTRRKRFLQNMAAKECEENGFKRECHLTREEQYEEGLRKNTYFLKRITELGLKDYTDIEWFLEVVFPNETYPMGIHDVMFKPTILKQATQEQKDRWLPLADRYQILGTYAQTELGHGTFLRGLETTATYDVTTKEFIIDSPTITATKFWPGGLGKTSNCCVVMAKLFIKGKDCGMQSFMVQIRDLETHQPLPGISVGDIGPKFGYGSMDNGFLRFNKVQIPRENMFMRYAQVLEDGTFVQPKNDRLVYGAMTFVRTYIVPDAAKTLSKAATIATRYSAVRKQSKIDPKDGEVQVIDFQTQQYKLFVQIATSYALIIAGDQLISSYKHVTAQIERSIFDQLPMLHALSSGLKAFSSWEMTYGIEQCRMACGGHGYNMASGIPKLYMHMVPACTYEGENTVLCLQTARYLMKCQAALESGQDLPDLAQFLKTFRGKTSRLDEKMDLAHLLKAYQYRAARMLSDASGRMKEQLGKGLSQPEAWNQSSQMLAEASMAFCHMFVVKSFIDAIAASGLDSSTSKVMVQLCQLYAAYGITKFSGQFTMGGFLSGRQVSTVQFRLYDLLTDLKPNAVALVDAFDYSDRVLDSDLGRYDGNVYESLLAYAKNSRLNETDVHQGFYKYQKPFVDSLRLPNAPSARL